MSNAAMAQLVEHILGKDEVPSSNLGSSSMKKPVCVSKRVFSIAQSHKALARQVLFLSPPEILPGALYFP